MKYLFLASLLFSTVTFSATVKITSFALVRMGQNLDHPLAELCGKVEGAEKTPSFIRVLVDPGSRSPGIYNTLADDQGKFCLAVVTYRGSADVGIIGVDKTFKAQIQPPKTPPFSIK